MACAGRERQRCSCVRAHRAAPSQPGSAACTLVHAQKFISTNPHTCSSASTLLQRCLLQAAHNPRTCMLGQQVALYAYQPASTASTLLHRCFFQAAPSSRTCILSQQVALHPVQ